MITLSSRQNPLVKRVLALKQKKYRYECEQFIIEGIKNVREALKSGVHLDHILINTDQLAILDEFESISDKVLLVQNNIFKELSDEKTPQGIIAVAHFYSYSMDEILTNGNIFLILDKIQDPGNMGTLIRSADAFGADGILISSGSCDVYSPKVMRAAMGSVFHLPFVYADIEQIMDTLEKNKILTIGTSPYSDDGIRDIEIKIPVAVLLGNEANGIDDSILERCDKTVKIEMNGKAESLNVAVAGSIIMYEILLKINR